MAQPATIDIVSKPRFLEGEARYFQGVAGNLAIRFEDLLEQHTVSCWGVFSVLYFCWMLLISNLKQLWFDELVTYAVDHVPTWGDAWRALQTGADANPPLFHLVNRAFLAVFGDTPFVQRGSSIFGFWAASLGLYAIVRRNHSAAAAWVAALVPSCSGAAYYATEARPYGMVLGFIALALICWLKVVDDTGARNWWLAGLSLSLSCAISSHYYSVFTVGPFIGAELTRALRRKRVDWVVVGAVMASYWPLVILYSSGLMGAANQYVGSTDNASLLSPVYFWQFVLGPVPLSILAAIGVALGWNCFLRKRVVFTVVPSNALLIGAWLCVLPVFVMLGGRYVTHAYEHRYAITAVIGAAMLIGAGFDLLRSAIPGAAGLAILALILPVSIDAVAGRSRVRGRHIDYGWSQQTLAEPTLPIIYSGPLESVQAWFNAPSPELKRRITCLVDVKEASQRMGSGAGDLGVINLKPALGLPAQGYREFTQQRKAFYLIHQPAMTTWVTKKLVEDGAELKLKGLFGPDELYLVTWRPGETGPSHQLRQ